MPYNFSGHQTFPFRYAWLTKGIRGLLRHPDLFTRPDAIVLLGVGKNMVASIRYWLEAMGLATVSTRKGMGRPTELGEQLFGPEGWDPYLEDLGTLWLLHWQLVKQPDRASTWHLAFTRWNKNVLTRDELLGWLLKVAAQHELSRVSRASLRRDVDVFLRTYLPPRKTAKRPVEDSFECPLSELGLIREMEPGLYQLVRGSKPTLPIEIFAHAVVRYWDTAAPDQATLSFERILYGPGSPGAAFQLSEPALTELLESLPRWTGLRYDETAGLRMLLRDGQLPQGTELLRRYYGRSMRGAAA